MKPIKARLGIFLIFAACCIVVRAAVARASDHVYYFHNDHLGTPQAMSDAAGRTVWTAEYDPFGKATVNQDPDGDGQIVVNNLRFPGQYYDAETGLHYNYHRDYDPATGRYLTPDPIGLEGGLNPYAYVDGNPVSRIDPNGLQYAETLSRYWPQIQQFGNQLLAAMIGLGTAIGIGEAAKECRDDDDCKDKISMWQLNKSGIDAHELKRDILGKSAKISLFDLCKCKSGMIVIRYRGCTGPIIPTGYSIP